MRYDDVRIEVLPGLVVVRKRPEMFFGVSRTDPALPGKLLWWAVRDALAERPCDPPLRVRVVVAADQRFVVEDDGPGLPVEPVAVGRAPAVAEMLTVLVCGQPPPRGWTLGAVTALCSAATAQVWTRGRQHRQRADWTGVKGPLEDLGPATRTGTRLDFTLDGSYFDEVAALPSGPAHLLAGLLQGAGLLSVDDTPAVGTQLEVVDRRTGVVARLARA